MDSTRDQLRGQLWSQDSARCLRKWRPPSFCRRRSRDRRGPASRSSSSCPSRCRIWKKKESGSRLGSRISLSITSLSLSLARSLACYAFSLSRSLARYALSLSLSLARSFVTLSLSLSLARSLARSLKRRSGGEWSSPRDEDTYVEVIRMICILGIQLVGPGSEAGQCIFGVGTNGQIYLRENHFEMEWDHFGILILDNARIIREILIFEICIFYIIRYNKFFKLKKKLESIGNWINGENNKSIGKFE